LLLAALGGVAGALLARGLLPVLRTLNPIETLAFAGVLRAPQLDGRMLAFLAAVTMLTGVASGLLPAWRAAGAADLARSIQQGGQRSGASAAGRRSLAVLVVAEVAIAAALLVGGGLMVQSFQRLHRMQLGFRPERLLLLHMELPAGPYHAFPRRAAFVEQVLQRVRQLPGVAAAGITVSAPQTVLNMPDAIFTVEGQPPPRPGEVPIAAHRLVSAGYLETLGVTLVAGRLLSEQDRLGSQPVAVISEELARQGFPGKDPIGKRIRRLRPGETFPWMTVVGVVKDVKEDRDNFRINRPVWYLPYAQQVNDYPLDLVVRASGAFGSSGAKESAEQGDPARLAPAIRHAVTAVAPAQPVSDVTTMPELLTRVLAPERFSAILMGALAATGLLLAVIGLYGVMAYSVRRQTGEIGLRLALGAPPAEIFKTVLGRGARLIAAGLLIGLAGAAALSRLLAATLYGVAAGDPLTFVAIALLLAAVATLACILPARRAMRVDPLVALRSE
jgi:putative ABC transport system permease protein